MVNLQTVVRFDEGILPDYFHAVLKFVHGTIYVLLQWYLLWQYSHKIAASGHKLTKITAKNWLIVFSLLNTILYLPALLTIVLSVHPDTVTIFALVVLGSYLLVCTTFLFFQPQILYGLGEGSPKIAVPPVAVLNQQEETMRSYLLPEEKRNDFKQKVEWHIVQQQAYLRKGYSIKDLSGETDIPLHQLSAFINSEYGVNFSDFVNRYRVEYAKEKLRNPQWRQLTLEGIALEAGFNNRITFFRAFTKHTGYTPSEYLNKQSASE
jgi:AraC-like DNA-binding protein